MGKQKNEFLVSIMRVVEHKRFMINGSWFMVMTDTTMIDRLKQFAESEMRSCSMDIGGITPLYVYRMWGGAVAIEDIATEMEDVRRRI